MIGTSMPRLSSCSTMCGTAEAASSLLTVTLTSSEPARARDATCSTVEATSAVSVLVMDCTTTGASDPTRTLPMVQLTDLRRTIVAMGKFSLAESVGALGSCTASLQRQYALTDCANARKIVLHANTCK